MAITPVDLQVTNITATSARLRWVNALQALITSLFGASEQGAIYIPRPVVNGTQALFKDAAGTTPVTADGDPDGLMIDQSPNSINASQSTSAARPTYNANPDRLSLDKIYDALIITVPAGGWDGTMVLATDQGTASYGISIPAGTYELGGAKFPGTAIAGAVFRDGAITTQEKADAESYFVGNGATASYGAVASFVRFWQGRREIIEFPLIDTSSGNDFTFAWINCEKLEVFPPNSFDNVQGGDFNRAFESTNLNESSIDGILASLVTSGIETGSRLFDQSGGSAPSVGTGQPAIDTLRSRGWTVTVTGGY